MADLSVKISDLQLKNPVMTASGTFGYGLEFADFVPLEEIGGIIVKGTTLEPREGNDYPRMVETPQGMLNCVGLQNKGVDYFIKHIYPQIKDISACGDEYKVSKEEGNLVIRIGNGNRYVSGEKYRNNEKRTYNY